MEREDESQDRNVNSFVLIVGFRGMRLSGTQTANNLDWEPVQFLAFSPDLQPICGVVMGIAENITAALADLHAGRYDLKTNPLIEMEHEIRGAHRKYLVLDNDNYVKVKEIQVGTHLGTFQCFGTMMKICLFGKILQGYVVCLQLLVMLF